MFAIYKYCDYSCWEVKKSRLLKTRFQNTLKEQEIWRYLKKVVRVSSVRVKTAYSICKKKNINYKSELLYKLQKLVEYKLSCRADN